MLDVIISLVSTYIIFPFTVGVLCLVFNLSIGKSFEYSLNDAKMLVLVMIGIITIGWVSIFIFSILT